MNPAKPTALKIAQGNPGHQKINHNEPKPKGKLGQPPSYLTKEAKQVWRYYAPKLDTIGISTTVDRAAFESFCRSYALWRILRKQGEKTPLVKMHGQIVPHPALSQAAKEQKEWTALAREFGLTPSARVKLSVDSEGDDDLSEFLKPPIPARPEVIHEQSKPAVQPGADTKPEAEADVLIHDQHQSTQQMAVA